jgi:hypothetical protein
LEIQRSTGNKLISMRERELSLLRGHALQMYDDKLDGTITKEIYLQKAAEIQARQAKIESELRSLRTDDNIFLGQLDKTIETFERLPIIYASSDNAGKADILRDLCTGIVYDGEKITIRYKPTFGVFINTKFDNLKRARVRDSSKVRPSIDEFRTLLAA